MKNFRYLTNVTTLELDESVWVGCGMCGSVCPHNVFEMHGQKVRIVDRDGCMECGACATNCPVAAIHVTPGVGCAADSIQTWIKRKNAAAFGGASCC
jgi:ferredoxin